MHYYHLLSTSLPIFLLTSPVLSGNTPSDESCKYKYCGNGERKVTEHELVSDLDINPNTQTQNSGFSFLKQSVLVGVSKSSGINLDLFGGEATLAKRLEPVELRRRGGKELIWGLYLSYNPLNSSITDTSPVIMNENPRTAFLSSKDQLDEQVNGHVSGQWQLESNDDATYQLLSYSESKTPITTNYLLVNETKIEQDQEGVDDFYVSPNMDLDEASPVQFVVDSTTDPKKIIPVQADGKTYYTSICYNTNYAVFDIHSFELFVSKTPITYNQNVGLEGHGVYVCAPGDMYLTPFPEMLEGYEDVD